MGTVLPLGAVSGTEPRVYTYSQRQGSLGWNGAMQVRTGIVAAFISLLCLLGARASIAAESLKTIYMVSDIWCPFTCEPTSPQQGYITEIARAAFHEHGYQVRYKVMPWLRAIRELKDGTADVLLGVSKDECPEAVFPRSSVGLVHDTLVTGHQDNWHYKGIESLSSRKLGVPDGYDIGLLNPYIARNRDNGKVFIIQGTQVTRRGLMMLNKGRIDTYLDVKEVVVHTAQQLGVSHQIRFAGQITNAMDIYIAVSPTRSDSARLAGLIANKIENLRARGRLKEILEPYGLKDWAR